MDGICIEPYNVSSCRRDPMVVYIYLLVHITTFTFRWINTFKLKNNFLKLRITLKFETQVYILWCFCFVAFAWCTPMLPVDLNCSILIDRWYFLTFIKIKQI